MSIIVKESAVSYENDTDAKPTIFTANSADYGGAVYVDDDTNSGTCASDPKTECFFQVLHLSIFYPPKSSVVTQCMYFSQNSANTSGSTLYGGLLDRCAVSQFAEVRIKYALDDVDKGGGIAYFKNVSATTDISISSHPVQICLCTDGTLTAPTKITLMLRRETHSQCHLWLLIRLANLVMQPSKLFFTSLRVV